MRSGAPFNYGWVIVGAAFVVLTTSYGMIFSYGLFLPHIMAELEGSRSLATLPFSLCVVTYATLSLFTGKAVDLYGPRPVALVGAALLGIGFWGLSQATETWQVFLFFGAVTGAGMSAAYIPMTATVVRWFEARRGLALAIASQGLSASVVVGPLIAAALILDIGWRSAALAFAIGGAFIIAMSGWMLRQQSGAGQADAPLQAAAEGLTLRQARPTLQFWIILTSYMLTWSVLFFPYAHLPGLASDLGFDAVSGAALLGAMGVGGAVGRFTIGTLSDWIGRKPALHLSLVLQTLACLVFPLTDAFMGLYLLAAIFGAGSGAGIALFPAIVGDIFGAKHVGAISGAIFAVSCGAGAFGPYAASLIREATGSYDIAFWIAAVFNVAAFGLVFALRGSALRTGR